VSPEIPMLTPMILFRCYSLTFPCLLCNQPSRDIIRTKTDCASSGCLREAVQLQPRVNESRFPASIFVAIQFTVIAIFSFRASSSWTPPVVRPSPLVEPSCQRHRTLQNIGEGSEVAEVHFCLSSLPHPWSIAFDIDLRR
jgi:hypothetical protein